MKKSQRFTGFFLLLILPVLPLQNDFKKFTPEQAAEWMEKRLFPNYGTIKVVVKEEKKEVSFNFNVKEKFLSTDDFYDFVYIMAVYVGEITKNTQWRSNKAEIFFGNKLKAWIYTKHCREAIQPERDFERMDYLISKLNIPEKQSREGKTELKGKKDRMPETQNHNPLSSALCGTNK